MKSITLKPELNELYTLNEFILKEINPKTSRLILLLKKYLSILSIIQKRNTLLLIWNMKNRH